MIVAATVIQTIIFCLLLLLNKKIFTKLMAEIKTIKKSRITLSRMENIFMLPSPEVPAKVGTNQVMAAHRVLSSNHRDCIR